MEAVRPPPRGAAGDAVRAGAVDVDQGGVGEVLTAGDVVLAGLVVSPMPRPALRGC
uniref:hypothetical protein n=1 Tax=Amycolatopsis sp. CA-096443 TaxID=3239919 RepID=UPI003F493B4D